MEMPLRYGIKFALGAITFFLLAIPGTSSSAKPTADETQITVGGTEHWHFGFNYSDWALKTAPFYINDSLVFKYDPPGNGKHPHSVYLLMNQANWLACDFSGAKLVADSSQGEGQGFEFALKKSQSYFFACGELGGVHCGAGLMKFSVFPLPSKRHDG